MDKVMLFGIATAAAILLISAKKDRVSGMEDNEASLENIRMGISRGWYTAKLTRVNGAPGVILSGKRTDGSVSKDVYPISEDTYQQLLLDGVSES